MRHCPRGGGVGGPFWRLVYSNPLERHRVNVLLAIFVRIFDSEFNEALALVHKASHLLNLITRKQAIFIFELRIFIEQLRNCCT